MIINSNYCQLDKVAQLSRAIRGQTKDHKFINMQKLGFLTTRLILFYGELIENLT